MSKVTLLALGSMLPPEMAHLEESFDVIRLWRETDPEAILHKRGREVKAIVSFAGGKQLGVSAKMMDALPNLEIITQFGVGYDNIDVLEARRRQIMVTNTPDILTNDTADTALALILAVMRRVAEGDMFIRTGKWVQSSLPLGQTLTGKRVGIIGLGRIGRAIARRCAAFDMTIVYHGRTRKADVPYLFYDDLVRMAGDIDVLVLACSGGEATHHMVDRAVLGAMKPTGFLVNISRGTVVDQDALVEALVNGKIAGAGLDVFKNEPHVPQELHALDTVVMTPHIGSATIETRTAMGQLVLDNLAAHFDGRPLLTPVAA
jgi:lactate dehydrogenase-like 2-hydroxyacid dehydrogenase